MPLLYVACGREYRLYGRHIHYATYYSYITIQSTREKGQKNASGKGWPTNSERRKEKNTGITRSFSAFTFSF